MLESGTVLLAEWRTLAALLAQMVEAHMSTFPEMSKAGVHAVLQLLRADGGYAGSRCDMRLNSPLQCAQRNEMTNLSPQLFNTESNACYRLRYRREGVDADEVGIEDALASSRHARFSSVARQLLVPCMRLILPGIRLHTETQGTGGAPLVAGVANMQARGRCWALLGAARLWLVAPAAGTDPAMKFALKKQHLTAHHDHDLQPEIEVPLPREYHKSRAYQCGTQEFAPLKCTHVLNIHTMSIYGYNVCIPDQI